MNGNPASKQVGLVKEENGDGSDDDEDDDDDKRFISGPWSGRNGPSVEYHGIALIIWTWFVTRVRRSAL